MAKPIKIVIGGREYSLKVEDEELIKNASEELNKQISDLELKYREENKITITTLAALNIAEKYSKEKSLQEISGRFIINEISKMANFLNERIDNN